MRFHSVLSVPILALSHVVLGAAGAATAPSPHSNVVLDGQSGPYPISIYQYEVKTSRQDPLAPKPQLRRLMITIYRPFLDNFTCPVDKQSVIPYAPPAVAAALLSALLPKGSPSNASSLLSPVKLINCTLPIPSSGQSGPLVLFSPGFGGTHDGYSSTLQATASSGYTVVAIDHTFESAAVIFPDGTIAYPSPATQKYDSTRKGQDFLQSIRIADSVSVLDAIESGSVPGLGQFSNSSHSSKPFQALMYGHSFGGSTAVNVALTDSRVLAGANLDGPYYPPVENGTMHKPVFMMQSSALPPTAKDWQTVYQNHLCGWKSWVVVNNTVHYGFTDLPELADLLGLRGTLIPAELTGTIGSRRLQEIMWRYTTQFFAYVLNGASTDLLDGPSTDFPDVHFVGHAEAESS